MDADADRLVGWLPITIMDHRQVCDLLVIVSPSSLSDSGFRAGSGRQSSRRRAVDLTANQRLLGARVPVSVAVAFVLGEEALAPPHWAEQRVNIRFRFQAMVTRLHSPRTLSSPRSRN